MQRARSVGRGGRRHRRGYFNASERDASVVAKSALEKSVKQLDLDIEAYCQGLDAQDKCEREAVPALDAEQLAPQALPAKEALEVDRLVADAGYYSEAQLAECTRADVQVYVPIPDKHGLLAAEGRFSGAQFHCAASADVYVCSGGEVLTPQGKPNGICGVWRTHYTRPATARQGCSLATVRLPERTRQRQVYRPEHAETLEAHRHRMAETGPERTRQRTGLAEHPFGTLKRRFGWDHFSARSLERVHGEMGLAVLGYNLTRVLNLLGLRVFRDYCARRLRDHRAAIAA